jgi:hypothetical protein
MRYYVSASIQACVPLGSVHSKLTVKAKHVAVMLALGLKIGKPKEVGLDCKMRGIDSCKTFVGSIFIQQQGSFELFSNKS